MCSSNNCHSGRATVMGNAIYRSADRVAVAFTGSESKRGAELFCRAFHRVENLGKVFGLPSRGSRRSPSSPTSCKVTLNKHALQNTLLNDDAAAEFHEMFPRFLHAFVLDSLFYHIHRRTCQIGTAGRAGSECVFHFI